ncbi:Os1348 family NHLP clan protein [Methylobacterium aquaticum]|jgi:hypothetical protein|uniref:Nif11 domain-containing protein n=2 Tax=Methylobacterium aquaticum TaxID=270351 RepID=A0A0J6UUK0_9HYPH|nr:Os1348 family NHLP clan protein [Methylobacterium aquaticum]KMO29891.1 hypothetical protein VP06_23390 [Methylobacterium aquaticum]
MTTETKEQKIDEILGRALRDKDFRDKLTNDPAAAAAECGLSVEEMDLIAGGLAIGDSLLNPQTVAWCTGKTCNETGKRQSIGDPRVNNPRVNNPRVSPVFRPQVRPQWRGEADAPDGETRVKEDVE